MNESLRFDRVAECYDRTRSISDRAMARTVELLANELRGRGRVLEVGVGTGLLGIPLREAGIDVVGLDLSEPMLRRLVAKRLADGRPAVVQADATRMPFGDDVFGGAYLRWVLHLVPAWRDALGEVIRVVRPGGVFLVALGAYAGARDRLQRRFGELTGAPVTPVGLGWDGYRQLDEAMRGLGASLRALPPVPEDRTGTLAEFLDGVDRNLYSWTWPIPEDVRLRAAAELRRWARERFGPLDEPDPTPHETVWHAYDLP
jgi:SAM-dependent methyltransferase